MNIVLLSALTAPVPLILGFVWYDPRFFGKAWAAASTNAGEVEIESARMPLIFISAYILAFMVAYLLPEMMLHQSGLHQLLGTEPVFITDPTLRAAYDVAAIANSHSLHSFGHGALYGTVLGLFLAVPIVGIPSLFDGRDWKYIGIKASYWVVSLALMGGLMCQFAP